MAFAPTPAHLPIATRRAAGRLIAGMTALLAVLLVLDAALVVGGGIATPDLQAVFSATGESGLLSFVCVTQVALVALTLAGFAGALRHTGAGRWRGWAALAAFFAYLAVDDGTRLHEGIGTAFAATPLGDSGVGNLFPSYYWQLVLGPLFALAGLLMLRFLWREIRAPRDRALVLSAFALLALAVAMDFAEGLPTAYPGNPVTALALAAPTQSLADGLAMASLDLVVHAFRAVEEAIETLAFTLFWAAFLSHIGATLRGVTLRFAPDGEAASSDDDSPADGATPAWIARPRAARAAAPDEALV